MTKFHCTVAHTRLECEYVARWYVWYTSCGGLYNYACTPGLIQILQGPLKDDVCEARLIDTPSRAALV